MIFFIFKGYRGDFSWERYLEETRSKAVPGWAFKTPKNEQSLFKKGMKLEVVDKWNPIFVRVATVVDVVFHQIKIHFDGWPHDKFDFWVEDDSPDLHPTSWCSKTGHPLMSPLSECRKEFLQFEKTLIDSCFYFFSCRRSVILHG